MSQNFRVGLFVAATLLILAAGVFLIGDRDLMFRSTYKLRTSFDTVAGLAEGAEVRIGGTHQGTVQHIDLPNRPDGKVTVEMRLDSSTRSIIKNDSVARIETEGLLGNKYVEVSFGSPEAPGVKNGDTVRSEPPQDLSDIVKKTSAILDSTQSVMQGFDKVTNHMNNVTAKIDEGRGTIGALINDKTLYKQAAEATTAAKEGAVSMQENMEALKHNFFLRGFFRNRGYEDSTELTKHQVARLPDAPVLKKFTYSGKRLFEDPKKAKLRNTKMLTETAKYLESNPFGLAVVVASTGLKGDSEEDQVLSEARAMVVRDYLVNNFKFDDTRLKTLGLGERPDSDETGQIDIVVYSVTPEVKATVNSADRSNPPR